MRLALATLWILAGSVLTAGVYWGFLITPESTIWALMVSAVLAIVALALAGLTASGAIAMWWHGASLDSRRPRMAIDPWCRSGRRSIVLLVWWLANRAEVWIAHAQRPDQRLVHRALRMGRHVVAVYRHRRTSPTGSAG